MYLVFEMLNAAVYSLYMMMHMKRDAGRKYFKESLWPQICVDPAIKVNLHDNVWY